MARIKKERKKEKLDYNRYEKEIEILKQSREEMRLACEEKLKTFLMTPVEMTKYHKKHPSVPK